jgi:hypothetical protein
MGMRQPAQLPARPAYGLPDAVLAQEQTRSPSPVIPLLVLIIGLVVATVWFVALPALERQPHPARNCEVIVLKSGASRCVREPGRGQAAAHKASTRAKR